MDKIYEGVICRGSISLGSACMKCEKCKYELEKSHMQIKEPPTSTIEYIEKYGHHHFQETPCGDCVKDAITIMGNHSKIIAAKDKEIERLNREIIRTV